MSEYSDYWMVEAKLHEVEPPKLATPGDVRATMSSGKTTFVQLTSRLRQSRPPPVGQRLLMCAVEMMTSTWRVPCRREDNNERTGAVLDEREKEEHR